MIELNLHFYSSATTAFGTGGVARWQKTWKVLDNGTGPTTLVGRGEEVQRIQWYTFSGNKN